MTAPPRRALPREVRIIGGPWKRSKLPGGRRARPAADARPRARDALQLARRRSSPAGAASTRSPASGALGFEAASRGAARGACCSSASRALVRSLSRDAARLGADGADRREADAIAWMSRAATRGRFDLVFLDPPFDCRPRSRRRSPRRCRVVRAEGSSMSRGRAAVNRGGRLAALGRGRAGAVHFGCCGAPCAVRAAASAAPTARAWRLHCASATRRESALTSVTRLTAVYPGTFDPMTLGHEDLMRRAAPAVRAPIVAVAAGHHKRTMFTSPSASTSRASSRRKLPERRGDGVSAACCATSSSSRAARSSCAACAR